MERSGPLPENTSLRDLAVSYLNGYLENIARTNLIWWYGFVRAERTDGQQLLYVFFLENPDKGTHQLTDFEAKAYERAHKDKRAFADIINLPLIDSRIIEVMDPQEAKGRVIEITKSLKGIIKAELVADVDFRDIERQGQILLVADSLGNA